MALNRVWVLGLAVVAGTLFWRLADQQGWVAKAPRADAAPIRFDNGSVRTPPPPASAPGLRPRGTPVAGSLRKCVRADQSVVYTDVECPPGSRERAVASDRVSVVPGHAGAAREGAQPPSAGGPQAPAAGQPTRQSLYQALDIARDDRLRERSIDRAVHGAHP